MKKSHFLAVSAITAAILGCGGGGNNPVAQTGTGYYVDNAVAGVSYKCGTQSGVTGDDGKFTFEKGADCSFTLAGIPLRTVSKTELADGKKIVEDQPEVAQLLQSLDADGDLSNGIQITPAIVEAVKKAVAEVKDPKKVIEDNTTKAIVISEVAQQVPEAKVELKPIEEVTKHLEKTKTQITKELLAGKTFYIAGLDEGTISLFKVKIDTNGTSLKYTDFISQETKTEQIKIEQNKIYFLGQNSGGYLNIEQKDGYILLNAPGVELRAYTNEAEAKKYYESLKKEVSVTADKIKAAFANKTLYRAKKYKDGTLKLTVISTTDNKLDFKAYINNTLDTKESASNIPYTIKDNTILAQAGNETKTLKVIKITNNSITILNDQEDGTGIWYYSQTEALANPEIRDYNYHNNNDNGGNTQVPDTPNQNLVDTLAGKTFYVYSNDSTGKAVFKLVINQDATSWSYQGILGNNDSGTETVQITEDTLIVYHPEESQPDPYKVLVLSNSIKLVNNNDKSTITLYYSEADAKAAYQAALNN